MRDARVTNWSELNDALFAESWNPDLGRFRSTFAYRGLADASYDLPTYGPHSSSEMAAPSGKSRRDSDQT